LGGGDPPSGQPPTGKAGDIDSKEVPITERQSTERVCVTAPPTALNGHHTHTALPGDFSKASPHPPHGDPYLNGQLSWEEMQRHPNVLCWREYAGQQDLAIGEMTAIVKFNEDVWRETVEYAWLGKYDLKRVSALHAMYYDRLRKTPKGKQSAPARPAPKECECGGSGLINAGPRGQLRWMDCPKCRPQKQG
jgi:hypothetical protein